MNFSFLFFVPFSPLCVCVFFFTVTTRLTRSNEGMIGKLEPEDRAVCSKGFVFTREHFFSPSLSFSLSPLDGSFSFFPLFLLSHLLFLSLPSLLPPIFAFLFSSSSLSLLLVLSFRFSERSLAFDVIEGSGWISVKRLFVRGSCIGGIRFPVTVQPLDWGS